MGKTSERIQEPGITLSPDWAEVAVFNMGIDGFNEYKQRVFTAYS